MSNEDEAERIRRIISLFRGISQDNYIQEAEGLIAATPDPTEIPMPDACHPALSHAADFVRKLNKSHVKILGTPRFRDTHISNKDAYSKPESMTSTSTALLTRKRYVGAAPFVGDPLWEAAYYEWSAWHDDLDRSISSSAELVWVRCYNGKYVG